MNKIDGLNSFQLDVLREVGNIGAGNAATALSSLLSDRVNMSVPMVKIINLDEVSDSIGGPENQVVGILIPLSGDITGMMMFVLEKKFLHVIIRTLLNKELDDPGEMTEMDFSAICEVGNILAGAYLNALSQLTGLCIKLSPPDIAVDMAGAIMSVPASMFGMIGDKALIIQEDFIGGEHITSHLIMVPELHSLDLLLKRLGVE